MADLPENRRRSSSSSSSSSDLSVRVERELGDGNNGSTGKDVEEKSDAVGNGDSIDNCGSSSSVSGIPGGLPKVTTLPPDISHGDKSESSPSNFKLEKSKTERHRHLRPGDAAQIFNDKIPVQEKLKLLNRIATVKDDGTVEFEVPGDVEPEAFGARSKHVNNVVDGSLDATDLHYIPPLNIVMLIVGTREMCSHLSQ
uniref:Uncharacterized protein n=1 Tax=Lotus japonicus TaxID=34305 RepID=I3SFY2_LOTJA|nr:unknown [Lotus japonicus]